MIPARILTLRLVALFFISSLCVFLPSKATASADARLAGKKNVLILNSYHEGFKWTDDITRGVISALEPMSGETRIFIEYMGTKWVNDDLYVQKLVQILKHKYSRTRFDLIISSDNDAFDFLRNHRDEVFGKIPVVFNGVNYFTEKDLAGKTLFTGVSETADLRESLELALRLHPSVKRIFVINDHGISGRRVKDEIEKLTPLFHGRARIEFEDKTDLEHILKDVETLPPDSLIFYTFFYGDPATTSYENSDCIYLISRHARVPVYGAWDFNLGYGIVGGKLTSGSDQGSVSGLMGLRILKGERVENIPAIRKSQPRFMFDYRQMERFGIRKSALPEGSVVINEPNSFHKVPKELIWATLIGLASLSGVILMLLYVNRQRKQSEEALQEAHDELETRVAERTEQLARTAEALRLSEERYALAVQGTNDGIWDLNPATGEAYHSPRWKRIIGYEDDEITGSFNEWESRVHPEDHQRVMEAGKAYEEGRAPSFEVEYRLRHKDGNYRWVLTRGACLRDSLGRAYRLAGSLTDITERKELEKQLLQAQKMESIGMLAGGVAHEFNNLLTVISGYGQVLQENIPPDDEHSRESIANVLKAAERAADLTRGLLAFSRKQLISPKPVHIDTLLHDISRIIQRIIGEDIELSTGLSGINLLVQADPGQIEQVLMNLATNSRDAMPHGGHLSVTTRQVVVEKGTEARFDLPEPGNYVLISVADTGTGIDRTSMERIFNPFYTTKEVGKGTGLGLSIAHGIIKQHNGSILVSSEPGKGTTFDIYLPLVEGRSRKQEPDRPVPLVNGGETLLVAEDEEIVRLYLKRILEKAGYKVIVANDGEDAVERFRKHDNISLIVSDVVMPRKSGKELVEEIRKLKPGIKVVFISGYAADIMHKKGILEEGSAFVTKPFQKNDLLQKIREVLDKD
ncbi:MAG: response regulator [Deltaproteobacteria bacterium]|nr:response regulator [Deltaproteobacteria bacterium]